MLDACFTLVVIWRAHTGPQGEVRELERIFRIDELEFNKDLYPRLSTWWVTVVSYADQMKAGSVFPPIEVGLLEDRKIIVDGWHRCQALQKIGEEYVKGIAKRYDSEQEIFIDAIKANNSHGLHLSSQDKVWITSQLLFDWKMDTVEIATLIKATPETLKQFISRIIRRPDGSRIYLKAPLARLIDKGFISKEEASLVDQTSFTVRDLRQIMIQLLSTLEGRVYPWEDPAMRGLAVEIYQLLGMNITIDDIK